MRIALGRAKFAVADVFLFNQWCTQWGFESWHG